jgi:hypothetical protein
MEPDQPRGVPLREGDRTEAVPLEMAGKQNVDPPARIPAI